MLWALSDVFRSLCFPVGISVDYRVMEIVGVDFDSGLKMGLSGISGFGAIESGCRRVQRSFSTANVLVNLLVEKPVKGLSTLFTRHLSRLVSSLERGLLHRSVAHWWSGF